MWHAPQGMSPAMSNDQGVSGAQHQRGVPGRKELQEPVQLNWARAGWAAVASAVFIWLIACLLACLLDCLLACHIIYLFVLCSLLCLCWCLLSTKKIVSVWILRVSVIMTVLNNGCLVCGGCLLFASDVCVWLVLGGKFIWERGFLKNNSVFPLFFQKPPSRVVFSNVPFPP